MARKNHNEEAMIKYFEENYDSGNDFGCDTLQEKIRLTLKDYDRCVNYPSNIRNLPNIADRYADHMMGLPSPFHPEFEHYKIEEQLREWNVIKDGHAPSRIRTMVENYWKYWALWLIEKAEGKRV